MSYVGNTNTTQAFTPAIDYFSGNGSTVAFTLSRPVASVAQVQVVVNNVAQNPSTAFTVNGNTITFTGAPSSGTNNIYVQYTSPITQVIAPGQGTVAPASLSQGGPSWDTSGNVTLTGSIALNNGAADGAQLTLSSSGYSDWNWDNYSGRLRAYYGSTEYFTINTSGNVGIGTSSPLSTAMLEVSRSTTVIPTATVTADAQVVGWRFRRTGGSYPREYYMGLRENSTAWDFYDNTADALRMRIDTSGNLLVGTTSSVGTARTSFKAPATTNIGEWRVGTNGYGQIMYNASDVQVGYIAINASTTTYATSSDYRLKENIAPMTGALDKVAALKPVTYSWKLDGSTSQGFIAHELAEVCPDAVIGEKDAVETYVDENGVEQTRPVYQGIDTSFLVATLTAAIQEQQAIITQLTERITALENK